MKNDVLAKYGPGRSTASPRESEVLWALKMRKVLWLILAGIFTAGMIVLAVLNFPVFSIVISVLGFGTAVCGAIFGLLVMATKGAEVGEILSKAKRLGVLEDE